MKQVTTKVVLFFFMTSLPALTVHASSQSELPVQGYIEDIETTDPLDGDFDVTFNLYTDCSSDDPEYTESQSISFSAGRYSTSIEAPLDIVQDTEELCLGISINDDDEMSPRLQYYATPYAYQAAAADTAQVAELAMALDPSALSSLLGSGLNLSGGDIVLDTSSSQTWTGSQNYSSQVIVNTDPNDTDSDNAAFKINPESSSANEKFIAVQNNGSDLFTVDAEGDVVISGNVSVTGSISAVGSGDITAVTAGDGLSGGGASGAVTLSLDESFAPTWTGIHTFNNAVDFNSDSNFNFTDTDQLAINTTLDATDANDALEINLSNATTAGTQRGLVIDNQESSGLTDSLLTLSNSDVDTIVTSGITLENAGGGFTTLLDTPSLDISGTGIISGATGITSSGAIAFSDLTNCDLIETDGSGNLACGVAATGDITGVTAGTGLTGGGASGDVTLNVDVGTTASKIVQLNGSAELPPVSGTNLTNLNGSNISSGTIADARLSANVSLLGTDIDSSEIAIDTIAAADIAPDAVDSSEIAADAVDSSELADTAVTAGSYTIASITVDADGRITAASSGIASSADINSVGDCTSGDCFVDGTNNTLTFEGSTNDANQIVLSAADASAPRAITLPDADGELSVLGQSIDSSEVVNDTLTGSDIDESTLTLTGLVDDDDLAVGAVDGGVGGEITDGTIDANDLAATTVAAGSYTIASITVDADGRITAASSGAASSADINSVGDCTSGDCFVDGTNNTLTFEGSTNDGFETTLQAADATASDKTITLPNTSGTLITTGDSGTVTGTMIDESTLSLTGLVDDDDLAAGSVDGGAAGEIADNSITADDIATGAVDSSELAATSVSAGSYTNADITVDADGRITAASSGSSSGFDPTSEFQIYDEFVNGAAEETGEVGSLGWLVTLTGTATDTQSNAATIGGAVGSYRCTSSATNPSGCLLNLGTTQTRIWGGEQIISVVKTPSNLANTRLRVGMADMTTGTGDPTDGVYFQYNSGTANWQGVTENNNTVSTCDTGVAAVASNWVQIKMVINAGGTQVDFYVNGAGAASCSITTNIPTASGRESGPVFQFTNSVTTSGRTGEIDMFYLQRSTGNRFN